MTYFKWNFLGRGRKRKRSDDGDIEYPADDYHDWRYEIDESDEIDEIDEIDESDESDESEESVDFEENIIYPYNSQKKFKSIVLENGLSVLLIEDPSALYSSAAMAIRYGSIHDPCDMNGLAHLVEHMLFNGTTENRGMNEFKELVNMQGGSVYAYTDFEYSGYSFALDAPGFKAALKMFANMFICPLMSLEHIEGEIKTINQEFELSRSFDSTRLEHLHAHTSPVDHIFNHFQWGNSDSFSQHDPHTIHDAALEKFRNHFVGINMKLVITAADSVEFLESLVEDYFLQLKTGTEIQSASPKYDPYKWKHGIWNHKVAYFVESLEKSQRIEISWIIPPVSYNHPEKRPEKLIQKLFCDESQGSLYALFKAKLWVTFLGVSVGYEANYSDVSASSLNSSVAGQIFCISLDSTDSGWEHRYEMVSYVYQFFNYLKNIDYELLSKHIDEDQLLRKMKFACFDFDDDQIGSPTQFPLAIAVNMLKFPVINAMSLDFDYGFGDAQDFKEMLSHFITKNMRIDLLSKPFKEEGERVPFFSFKYKQESIPLSYLHRWETFEELDPELHLPVVNELMPTRFWQVLEGHVGVENEESCFVSIGDKSFYKDDKQMLSKASINIYLNPGVGVVSHTTSRILFEMLKHELSPLLLKGELAYINSHLSYGDDNAIELRLKGYHEKFKELITSIWTAFKSFKPTRHSFEYIIEKMKTESYSQERLPHAISLLLDALTDGPITTERKFQSVGLISFEELERLVPTLLSETRSVAVFSGKLPKRKCKQICNMFQPNGNFEIQSKVIRKLSHTAPHQVFAKPLPNNHTNRLAMVYFQLLSEDFDADLVTAFVHLLKALIDEKLYCCLRLEKRACYDLGCEVFKVSGTTGVYLHAASSDYKSEELMGMIHSFISNILAYLGGLDAATFKTYRARVGIPYDFDMSELIKDDKVLNGNSSAASKILAVMNKELFIKLFNHYFVLKPSTIEVYVG